MKKKNFPIQNAVNDDRVPAVPDVEPCISAFVEQCLNLLQCTGNCKADTDDAVAGRMSAACEDLIKIDPADACFLGNL